MECSFLVDIAVQSETFVKSALRFRDCPCLLYNFVAYTGRDLQNGAKSASVVSLQNSSASILQLLQLA